MRGLIIIVLYLSTLSIYSQEILDWHYSTINFEDTSEYKYVSIDTNSIWYVTKPEKQILFLPSNYPDLGAYAIISDTNDYYPIKVKS
jgi:hypothetical protein